ncbi:hypothetical protein [Bacteroides caecimuris]|uniref:hypothetical protein n=1 Tax=Bacteroides caecimuris TaxID=1796613 RepID=UPI0025B75E99|nr:hypothetical protein [Bacteroides caecimuris]
MKIFLFPHCFRQIGWIVLLSTLLLGILLLCGALSISGILETILNDTAIIGIALGSIFVSCSREVIEDEMTSAIRLKALLTSLYTYVVFLIIWTLAVNGIAYIYIMAAGLVMLPLMFVVRFRYEMHKYNKEKSDEEQD